MWRRALVETRRAALATAVPDDRKELASLWACALTDRPRGSPNDLAKPGPVLRGQPPAVPLPRQVPLSPPPTRVALHVLGPPPWTAAETPAWMSWSARRLRHEPFDESPAWMTMLKPVLGENLKVLYCELECQRSAGTTLLNSMLGETLEDLHHLQDDHEVLECH